MNGHLTHRVTYVHVCKVPPSMSGVSRYGQLFERVVREAGVRLEPLPSGNEATDTTTIRSIARLAWRLRAVANRLGPEDIVHVELSGRALAEFYSTALLVRGRRRPQVWLTLHDPPSVVGWSCCIALLDRKGLRTSAELLSRHVGRRVEGWLLRRADRTFVLSREGQRALQTAYTTDALPEVLPHVAPIVECADFRDPDRPNIFICFPVSKDVVRDVLAVAAAVPDRFRRIFIGAGDVDAHEVEVLATAANLAGRVDFVDRVDEERLDEIYRASEIVIRVSKGACSSAGSRSVAASGPVFDALRHRSIILTNMAKGAKEWITDGGSAIVLTADAREVADEVRSLLEDPPRRRAICMAAGQLAVDQFDASRVASVLFRGAVVGEFPSGSATPSER